MKCPETFKMEGVDLCLMAAGGVNFKRESLQWNFLKVIFSPKVFSLPLVSEDGWTDGQTSLLLILFSAFKFVLYLV